MRRYNYEESKQFNCRLSLATIARIQVLSETYKTQRGVIEAAIAMLDETPYYEATKRLKEVKAVAKRAEESVKELEVIYDE
jgi:hypothetical protein